MDHFENIVKTLLEAEGHWVRQSFKVNLSKEEKRQIGKPSIPRPEIDLLAFSPLRNEVIAFEVKSFLDSPGVKLDDLKQKFAIPEGRYKLFTCDSYRSIVFLRLSAELVSRGMATTETIIRLGLAAGKVYQNRINEVRDFMDSNEWVFWSPDDIKQKVISLANQGYENNAAVITAKILMR